MLASEMARSISALSDCCTRFEDDIDAGASFVSLDWNLAKIFATMLAGLDGGRFDGLDRTGVV